MATGPCLLAFLAFVLELAIVHNTADGRPFRGRNFDQIQPGLPSEGEGLGGGDNAQLRLVLVNYANR